MIYEQFDNLIEIILCDNNGLHICRIMQMYYVIFTHIVYMP